MSLEDNQKRILNVFRQRGTASKAEVARAVQLTHPAVGQNVKKLTEQGYLEQEPEKRKGPRGQPATLLRLAEKNLFIGIHVGRNRLDFVALALTGKVIAQVTEPVGFLQKASLQAISHRALKQFLDTPALRRARVLGFGISTPYFWQGWQSILPSTDSDDQAWHSDTVTRLFDFPAGAEVIVENDGASAALGELTYGTGADHNDFLFVNLGTFIGGGLVIDGTVRRGAHGNSAALGPFPISRSNRQPARADRPFEHLLSRASLNALKEHAKTHGVTLDNAELSGLDTHTAPYLAAWIEDCADALAEFFIGVWSLIDIEVVVIDSALPSSILAQIIDAVQTRVQHFEVEGIITCELKQGVLGAMAPAIGAACLPILKQLGPPPNKATQALS